MKDLEKGQAFLDSLPTQENPFQGLLTMEVTYEMVQKIEDAKFAWREFIPQGHMVVICAKANGGKTTLMTHIAGELAMQSGYQVLYINADASASDIKEYKEHAMDFGYRLINPDITNGSANKVVEELRNIADQDVDYSKDVIVLDTLKKFVEMMNKTKAKEFYSLLRTLTSKGMTIICLAHTNKYSDKDNMPIYEGTGDTRNDFDDLIYLIPVKNQDGTISVSSLADKTRAKIRDISFVINANREVEILNQKIDTLAIAEYQRHIVDDQYVIEFINEHIKFTSKSVTELRQISIDIKAGISRKRLETVLKRYCAGVCHEPKWLSMKAATYGFKYGLITDAYAAELAKKVLM
jgi:KaiC/GvpD/RAD55 family RecA-like ATPase